MPSAHQVLQTLVVRMTLNASNYSAGMMNAIGLQHQMLATANAMGTALTRYVTLPLTIVGATSVLEFGRFDRAMTQSLSIMEGVGAGLRKEMEDQAKLLSTKTATAADTLAKSYYYLAQTGLSAEASLKALNTVNNFALAGMFDQAKATDLLTDAQTSLGLTSKDSAEMNAAMMTYLSDRIVKAATVSNASVEQFSHSLTTKSAAAMRFYGVAVEEGLAVLAAYSDQGQKGQNAGNLYDRALRLISQTALENAAAHKLLGFQVFDAAGKMRSMADIVDNLDSIMKNLTPEQKTATLAMLGFVARSQQAITPLLGMGDAIRDYEKAIRTASGFTADIAIKAQQNLIDQMTIVWNRVKLVAMEIGEMLVPAITFMVKVLDTAIATWNLLPWPVKAFAVGLGVVVGAIGPLIGLTTAYGIALHVLSNVIAQNVIGLTAMQVRTGLLRATMATMGVFVMTSLVVAFVTLGKEIANMQPALDGLEKTMSKWADFKSEKMAKQIQDLRAIQDEKKREAAIDIAMAEKKKEFLAKEAQMNSLEAQARKEKEGKSKREQAVDWAHDSLFGAKTAQQVSAEMARKDYERLKAEMKMLEDLKKTSQKDALDAAVEKNINAQEALLGAGLVNDGTGAGMIEALDKYIDGLGKVSPLWKAVGKSITESIKGTNKLTESLAKGAAKGTERAAKWLEDQAEAGRRFKEKEAEKAEREAKKAREERERLREERNKQIQEAQKGDAVGLRSGLGGLFDTWNQTRAGASGWEFNNPVEADRAEQARAREEQRKSNEVIAELLLKIANNTKVLKPEGALELLLNGGF